MKINLSNKVAVVTGAAGNGLGRADALALGQAGAQVAILDIADQSESLKELQSNNIDAKAYACDIANTSSVDAVIKQIVKDFGTIHVLINNASVLDTVGFFSDIPVEKWNRDIQINLIGTANVTRAVWPYLLNNNWGRVVFMSSVAGTRGGAGQTSYASTKASMVGLAKSLALEGAKKNITSNVIAPGILETEKTMAFIREDMLERMKKSIPMRRFGRPEDIANTIVFLCSDQAAYITGQTIEIDGGSGLFVF